MKTKIINLTKELILITSFVLLAVYCLTSCDTYNQDCVPSEEKSVTNKFIPARERVSKTSSYPDLVVKANQRVVLSGVKKLNSVTVLGNGQLVGSPRHVNICKALTIQSNGRVELQDTTILVGKLYLRSNSNLKASYVQWYYEYIKHNNANIVNPTRVRQASNGESLCNGGTLSMNNVEQVVPVYVCD